MSVKVNITDQTVQITKRDTDGNVTDELSYEPPDGLPVTGTKGQLLAHNGTEWMQLGTGTSGYVLSANPAASLGVEWIASGGGGTGMDVYDVTDYGALGDGTTDDTAAISAALTAASGGGTVYFPRGTYRVTSALTTITFGATDDETLRLTGEGSKSRIYLDSNNGAFALLNIGGTDGRARVEIDHLLFRGNPATGADLQYSLLYLHDMGQSYIHDCQFFGLQQSGASEFLVTASDTGFVMERCWFAGTASTNQGGAVSVYTPHHCVIRDTVFIDYGNLDGAYYSKTPNGNSYWIQVIDSTNLNGSVNTGTIRIEGCQFDEGVGAAAVLIKSSTGSHTFAGVHISDINILLGAGNGFLIQRSWATKIERINYNTQGNNRAIFAFENTLGTVVLEDVHKNTSGVGTGRLDLNQSTVGGYALEVIRCDDLSFSAPVNPLYSMRGVDNYGRKFIWCKSTAAIAAYTLVKAAGGTTSHDVTQLSVSDTASQVFGIAFEAAGGAGQWIKVWPTNCTGGLSVLLSDGAGAISVGDAIGVSAATAGYGKKVTSGNILGRCLNTVAATPGEQIYLYLNKEAY